MITKKEIEQFYLDVDELGLKFPVAAIAKATGESKGNVSKYLNRKSEPSESFLQKFNQKFPKSSKIVPRETALVNGSAPNKDLSAAYIAMMEERIKELKEDKKWLQNQMEANLTGLVVGQKSLLAHLAVSLEQDALRDAKGDKRKADQLKDNTDKRIVEVIMSSEKKHMSAGN